MVLLVWVRLWMPLIFLADKWLCLFVVQNGGHLGLLPSCAVCCTVKLASVLFSAMLGDLWLALP